MRTDTIFVQVVPQDINPAHQHLVRYLSRIDGALVPYRCGEGESISGNVVTRIGPDGNPVTQTLDADVYAPYIETDKLVCSTADASDIPGIQSHIDAKYPNKRDKLVTDAINYSLDLWERQSVKSRYGKKKADDDARRKAEDAAKTAKMLKWSPAQFGEWQEAVVLGKGDEYVSGH